MNIIETEMEKTCIKKYNRGEQSHFEATGHPENNFTVNTYKIE